MPMFRRDVEGPTESNKFSVESVANVCIYKHVCVHTYILFYLFIYLFIYFFHIRMVLHNSIIQTYLIIYYIYVHFLMYIYIYVCVCTYLLCLYACVYVRTCILRVTPTLFGSWPRKPWSLKPCLLVAMWHWAAMTEDICGKPKFSGYDHWFSNGTKLVTWGQCLRMWLIKLDSYVHHLTICFPSTPAGDDVSNLKHIYSILQYRSEVRISGHDHVGDVTCSGTQPQEELNQTTRYNFVEMQLALHVLTRVYIQYIYIHVCAIYMFHHVPTIDVIFVFFGIAFFQTCAPYEQMISLPRCRIRRLAVKAHLIPCQFMFLQLQCMIIKEMPEL